MQIEIEGGGIKMLIYIEGRGGVSMVIQLELCMLICMEGAGEVKCVDIYI